MVVDTLVDKCLKLVCDASGSRVNPEEKQKKKTNNSKQCSFNYKKTMKLKRKYYSPYGTPHVIISSRIYLPAIMVEAVESVSKIIFRHLHNLLLYSGVGGGVGRGRGEKSVSLISISLPFKIT